MFTGNVSALKDSGVQDLNFSLDAARSISLSSSSSRPGGTCMHAHVVISRIEIGFRIKIVSLFLVCTMELYYGSTVNRSVNQLEDK